MSPPTSDYRRVWMFSGYAPRPCSGLSLKTPIVDWSYPVRYFQLLNPPVYKNINSVDRSLEEHATSSKHSATAKSDRAGVATTFIAKTYTFRCAMT